MGVLHPVGRGSPGPFSGTDEWSPLILDEIVLRILHQKSTSWPQFAVLSTLLILGLFLKHT
jgi:hypothetical protein